MFFPVLKQLLYINYLNIHFEASAADLDLIIDIVKFFGWIPTFFIACFYFTHSLLELI